MNEYFPPNTLSIEPGIALLISDSIYGRTGNNIKQLETLRNLFTSTLAIETEIYLLEVNEPDIFLQENVFAMGKHLMFWERHTDFNAVLDRFLARLE